MGQLKIRKQQTSLVYSSKNSNHIENTEYRPYNTKEDMPTKQLTIILNLNSKTPWSCGLMRQVIDELAWEVEVRTSPTSSFVD